MSPGWRRPRRGLALVIGLAVVVAAVASSTTRPVSAGPTEDLPVQVPGELSEGNWAGTGEAWGDSIRTEGGIDFLLEGIYDATLQLTVDAQSVDGLFDLDGTWRLTGEGAGVQVLGIFDGVGGGTISGGRTELVLDGTSSSSGTLRIEVGGETRQVDSDHPQTSATLQARVTSSTCAEASLEWAFSFNVQLENTGWSPLFDGNIALLLDVEELRGAVEEWLKDTRSGIDVGELDPLSRPPGLPGSVIAVEGVLREFSSWAQTSPMNPWQETAALLHDAEGVLNRIRNASPCDQYLLGADVVEQFVSLITDVIARGIDDLLFNEQQSFDELSAQFEDGTIVPIGAFADVLWQLVSIGLRTGVIGAGAADADRAARTEELLRRHAERVLTPFADPDGSMIENNAETRAIFAIGAEMDWTFEVRGTEWYSRGLTSEYGDSTDFDVPGESE